MSDTQFFFNQEITSFDGTVFEFFHGIAEGAGGFFTPFAKIISLLGSKGIVFFLLSIVFMLFCKDEKGRRVYVRRARYRRVDRRRDT